MKEQLKDKLAYMLEMFLLVLFVLGVAYVCTKIFQSGSEGRKQVQAHRRWVHQVRRNMWLNDTYSDEEKGRISLRYYEELTERIDELETQVEEAECYSDYLEGIIDSLQN